MYSLLLEHFYLLRENETFCKSPLKFPLKQALLENILPHNLEAQVKNSTFKARRVYSDP